MSVNSKTYRQPTEAPEGYVKPRRRAREERGSFKNALRAAMAAGDWEAVQS